MCIDMTETKPKKKKKKKRSHNKTYIYKQLYNMYLYNQLLLLYGL